MVLVARELILNCLIFFFKMCQKYRGTTETYPCADTVTDFKVESDGTTTIMYAEHTEGVYKRYREIPACARSKRSRASEELCATRIFARTRHSSSFAKKSLLCNSESEAPRK